MTSRPSAFLAVLALAAGAIGCGGGSAPQPGETPAQAEARDIFRTRCSPCHGPQGRGDGAAAAALQPAPRDLGLAAWQDSVDDAYIERIILGGGAAVEKSPLMPPNPDLATKPETVTALRELVRGLRR